MFKQLSLCEWTIRSHCLELVRNILLTVLNFKQNWPSSCEIFTIHPLHLRIRALIRLLVCAYKTSYKVKINGRSKLKKMAVCQINYINEKHR